MYGIYVERLHSARQFAINYRWAPARPVQKNRTRSPCCYTRNRVGNIVASVMREHFTKQHQFRSNDIHRDSRGTIDVVEPDEEMW